MSDPNAAAPRELAIVQRFMNTADIEAGTDELGGPDALGRWLVQEGLAESGDAFNQADLDRVIAFREALRRLLLSHTTGDPVEPDAVAALDAAARDARIVVGFGADGAPRLEPAGGGVAGALGRLLGAIAQAQVDGSWVRLKVCLADDCRWAYYDTSRNRSRTWCAMSVCGNRSKARAYRRRAAGHETGDG